MIRSAIEGRRSACVVAISTSARAAWSYEAPRARMKDVDHWIGFWNDVQVE